MSEDFLHYIWKFGLYDKEALFTDSGERVTIISPGVRNSDSGPDFMNARIRIDDSIFAGNVEIHIKSSDWLSHKHHKDESYSNIILHVVKEYDFKIADTKGQTIPTVVLTYPAVIELKYNELNYSDSEILCKRYIADVDKFKLKHWLLRMAAERLESKISGIDLKQSGPEFAFYLTLFKSFGFKTNSLPFEMLCKTLPLRILKSLESVSQYEALLLGQAGMLDDSDSTDDYAVMLTGEYRHLSIKYELKNINKSLWKFARMRPVNFPSIRIAQLASLLHENPGLLTTVLNARDINEYFRIFDITASEYWNNRYMIGKLSESRSKKRLGKSGVESVLINSIIPYMFAYGKLTGEEKYTNKALDILEKLPPEDNSPVREWFDAGVCAGNASESQALIHLKSEYCRKKKCLQCAVGKFVLSDDK